MMKTYRISLEGKTYEVQVEDITSGSSVQVNPVNQAGQPVYSAAPVVAQSAVAAPVTNNTNVSGVQNNKSAATPSSTAGSASGNDVAAPVTGTILRFEVAVGDVVQAGQTLIILEAMKMETEVQAPKAGKVSKILVASGANVNTGQALLMLEDE